jgi:muramidase (phage lysozyme)
LMFDDLIPQASAAVPTAPEPDITPLQRSFLNAMRGGESGGRYNVMYGGKTFDSFADHPRQPQPILSGPNAGRMSTAAGADQFLAGTWDEAKNALGLPDFSPKSQDRAAIWLAARDYKKRTGRDLWADVDAAQGDPARLNIIGGALSGTWTSLPGGIEPNKATAGFGQRFATELSSQARRPQQPQMQGLSFDDLIPAQTAPDFGGAFQAPQNEEALRAGLQQRAQQMQAATRGPAVDPGVRQSVEFQNRPIAGGQGTTPIMDLQMKNLITDQVFENDAGLAVFRDPATGQLVEADQNKHVILRDPADNRLKVFARTAETNENPLVSGARILEQGLLAGAPTARATVAAAPALKPSQEVAQAAGRIGVEVPRAVTTDSMAVQRVAGAVRNIPLAGDPLISATGRTVQQLGDKASEVAQGYGGGTVAGSGDAARGAINRYVTGTTKERATKLYDAVDDLVDNNVLSPLAKTQEVVGRLLARRNEAALPPGGAIDQLNQALGRPGMTYQGIKTLRTNVGEDVARSILPQGMSQGDLKQIYSALSDDLKNAVKNAGGSKALTAFERANRYYNLVSSRREALAKIVGAAGDAPAERVFDRLVAMASGTSRADIAGLTQARKAIGADDWNEFVSGVVAQMGRSPAARGAPESLQGVDFSPERFLTAYNKLSDAGRNVLFKSGGKGELATALRDIATVSSRFRELQKFSNPSGTTQNTIGAVTGVSAVTPLFMGDIATPLAVVGSVVGGRMLASFLARPAAAASIADWSKKYEAAVRTPTAPKVALLTVASRNLANTLKDSGVTVSAQDFLRAIQGPKSAPAEQEQQ